MGIEKQIKTNTMWRGLAEREQDWGQYFQRAIIYAYMNLPSHSIYTMNFPINFDDKKKIKRAAESVQNTLQPSSSSNQLALVDAMNAVGETNNNAENAENVVNLSQNSDLGASSKAKK